MDDRPLVSILSNVKNRSYSIRRCVESIVNQDYENIEHIIQDGASTDGTREILQEYAERYPERIKLVSEPDHSGAEAFFRALKRMKGTIMGTCLSDEELLPHAVSWAVARFGEHPQAGAVYGDCHSSDLDGNIIQSTPSRSFTIAEYLCHEVVPPFAASFFRTDCLKAIGLFDSEWSTAVGEFELWVRLGLRYPVQYTPGFVAKFGVHPGSNTSKPEVVLGLVNPRLEMMGRLFNDPQTPEELRRLAARAYSGLHLWVAESLIRMRDYPAAVSQIEAALQYKPNIFHLADTLVRLAERTSEFGGMPRRVLEMAVKLDDSQTDVRYLYAAALSLMGDDVDAEILAQAALDSYAEIPGAYAILNRIAAKRGGLSGGTASAAEQGKSPQAPALNAGFSAQVDALVQQGASALAQANLEEAAGCFRQAVQKNPAARQAWEGLAETARQSGDSTTYEWALSQARALQS